MRVLQAYATQSLAILEWLEETYPAPALLPTDAAGRARVRAMFLTTAADTHPLVVPRAALNSSSGSGRTTRRESNGLLTGFAKD